MRRYLAIVCVLFLSLAGCAESDVGPNNGGSNNGGTNNGGSNNGGSNNGGGCVDQDQDGFDGRGPTCPSGEDCNDRVPSVNPDAEEICGDRTDNDCDGTVDNGCDAECLDEDGDRYGEGEGCLGPDCDDTDPDRNPGNEEICGNGIDEDCSGDDKECPTNCTDEDGDGYGTADSTDCETDEVDCDDSDPDVHPMATEVCNDKDDNCNDETDECPLDGQVCSGPGGECQGGAGAQCENQDDCAGMFLTCDTSVDPKVCKQAEGGSCGDESDCVDGLGCDNGKCTGDWCALNTCDQDPYTSCDTMNAACVECPYWDPDPQVQDAECTELGPADEPEQCVPGGWCAANMKLDSSDPWPNTDTTDAIFWMSIAIANCWIVTRPEGEKDICYTLWIGNDVNQDITESMVQDAYTNGDMDNELFQEENDALDDVWGVGLFDRKEMDWKEDLVVGTAKEYCLWYQPGGFFGGETLVVDRCENFVP